MLSASRELHKYFHDCKDTLQRVNEKARGVSDELGRDAISVGALQRKHHNFMQDLTTLQQQVRPTQVHSPQMLHITLFRELGDAHHSFSLSSHITRLK